MSRFVVYQVAVPANLPCNVSCWLCCALWLSLVVERLPSTSRPVETLTPWDATPLCLTMAKSELAPCAGPLGVRKQNEPKWTIIIGNHWGGVDITATGVARRDKHFPEAQRLRPEEHSPTKGQGSEPVAVQRPHLCSMRQHTRSHERHGAQPFFRQPCRWAHPVMSRGGAGM